MEECLNCGREIDEESEEVFQSEYGDPYCEDCIEEESQKWGLEE